jgi:hypothetical protein
VEVTLFVLTEVTLDGVPKVTVLEAWSDPPPVNPLPAMIDLCARFLRSKARGAVVSDVEAVPVEN